MKYISRLFFIIIWLLWLLPGCDKAAPDVLVHIPDPGFLHALIAQDVDGNRDGLISLEEAEAIKSLLIPPSGISDLTGLEAFINLDSFEITLNPLSGIDLSASTALKYLNCTSCELSTLDVSDNLLLEELICNRNSLSELDISKNQSLTSLSIKNNLFARLDLAANTGLVKMLCCGNQFTKLDISSLKRLKLVGVDNMPMLTEVCVWTLPFPPEDIILLDTYSPNVVYTDQCSGF